MNCLNYMRAAVFCALAWPIFLAAQSGEAPGVVVAAAQVKSFPLSAEALGNARAIHQVTRKDEEGDRHQREDADARCDTLDRDDGRDVHR